MLKSRNESSSSKIKGQNHKVLIKKAQINNYNNKNNNCIKNNSKKIIIRIN